MRGISKEELRRLRDHYFSLGINPVIDINNLIEQCKELNPWLPIDENTPKDKYLLMFISGHGKEVMRVSEIKMWSPKPTHWQELPDDTK